MLMRFPDRWTTPKRRVPPGFIEPSRPAISDKCRSALTGLQRAPRPPRLRCSVASTPSTILVIVRFGADKRSSSPQKYLAVQSDAA